MAKPSNAKLNQAIRSNSKTIKELLEAGADVNGLHKDRFRYERPLEAAADMGSKKIVQMLLDAGADPNGSAEGESAPALYQAVFHNTKKHIEVVRLLIEAGADVNYTAFSDKGEPSCTVLSRAAGHAKAEVVETLLDAGAHINAFPRLGTPLMEAAGEGRLDNVELLLDRGADASLKYAEDLGWHYAGYDAIDVARYNNKRKVVQFLEEHVGK